MSTKETLSATAQQVSKNQTILLVEDEDNTRKLLHGYLAAQGYKVLTASDGETGLIVGGSYTGAIDLLVTDIVMPKLNGAKMAHQLMEKHPMMKTLYISGYTYETVARHGVQKLGTTVLHKPFKLQVFLDHIRQVLAT